MPNASIDAAEFEVVRKLVRDRAGIVLDDGKEYLVEARLMPVARQEKLPTVRELVARIRTAPFGPLHHRVIEAMTTNETFFFRDSKPFEALRNNILPRLMEQHAARKQISIWCAACSSGQEPYSVAMLMRECLASRPDWRVRILASDLSQEMIARAAEGRYNQLEVNRGLPAPYLVRYFERQGMEWRIREEIRRMVEFIPVNLITPWPPLPVFDVIFLRNVLIYFDNETKKSILAKVHSKLSPGGYLFLGGAETTLYLDQSFAQIYFDKAACYQPRNAMEKPHAIAGR